MGDDPEYLNPLEMDKRIGSAVTAGDESMLKDEILDQSKFDANMISLELGASGLSPAQSKSKISKITHKLENSGSKDSLEEMSEIKFLY